MYNYSIINYKKLGECPPSPDKEIKLIYPTEEILAKSTGMITDYDEILKIINIDNRTTNVNLDSILYTLSYIWTYFKKGAFVRFVNNKLETFIVFYNLNYKNPLKKYFKETYGLNVLDDSIFNWSYIKNDKYFNSDTWVPPYEIDDYYKLFTTLSDINTENIVNETNDNDKVFCGFILFRDTLLSAKDNNPWKHLKINDELKKHFIKQPLCKIFNDCGHKDFYDIPIPSTDDIKMLMNNSSDCDKIIGNSNNKCELLDNIKFKDKENKIFFRGSATGTGNIHDNPRIYASINSKMSSFLDFGITQKYSWNKIYFYKGRIVNTRNFINKLVLSPKVPSTDYSKYKILVNIDGNIAANRKNTLLCYGSNVIGFKNEYYDWFDEFVKSKGYLSIKNYNNLEDIINDANLLFSKLNKNIKQLKKLYILESLYEYMNIIINL